MNNHIDDNLKLFKEELCKNCKSKDCDKGISMSIWNKQILMKCLSYSPKEIESSNTYEVDRYYDIKEDYYAKKI